MSAPAELETVEPPRLTLGGRGRALALPLVLLGLPALLVQLLNPVPRLDADAVEYFSQLRSLYFDHDVDLANEFEHFGILGRGDKTNLTVTGKRRTNFSVGPALLWLPFYAGGDLVARARGQVEDGYSPAHIRSVCLASLTYGVAGLLLLYGVLAERHGSALALWTTLLLLYATFLFWYLTWEAPVSHALSFFLAAVALRLFWDGRAGLSLGRAAALGLALGLGTSVRWQNAVLLLLPAPLVVSSFRRDVTGAVGRGALLLGGFLVGVAPQLLVFRSIFGAYLLPYPLQGRDYLRLDHPFWLETFFSSRHGLLYWSPVLWGGFVGLAALARRERALVLAVLPSVVIMSWVNASSGDWWAGGSFSNRRFDSVLPFLALGLAVSLAALRNLVSRRPGLLLSMAAAVLGGSNLLLMAQYQAGEIPRRAPVAFAEVAGRSAGRIAAAVGTPLAWPANLLFAARHRLPAARWDTVAGKYLFHRQNNLGGLITMGDGNGDPALLAEGWGPVAPCGDTACRAVAGRARLFAPLATAEALDIAVVAAGAGALQLEVNGNACGRLVLDGRGTSLPLRVAAGAWRTGLNEVVLASDAAVAVRQVRFVRAGAERPDLAGGWPP